MEDCKDILKKLIAFPTTADNTFAMHEAITYIAEFLRKQGMFVKVLNNEGSESIIASTYKDTLYTPKVCLAAHLDVMHAPDDMFIMREDAEHLYGRGVFDMKFAIASYLCLVQRLRRQLSRYDFGILITTDEELGGTKGVGWILAQGYRPTITILPDHGNNNQWNIEQSAKGALWLKMAATGKTAHASRVWDGENAILKLAAFLNALHDELFADEGPLTNTMNVGRMTGGKAANQVPGTAEAWVDVRFVNQYEHDQLLPHILTFCNEHAVQCEVALTISPHAVDLSAPLVQELRKSTKKVTQVVPKVVHSLGATDARFFDEYNATCIVLGLPGGGHHSDAEWLSTKDFYLLDNVLYDYLDKVALTEELPRNRP